jgi:hypothetical protein
VYSQLFSTQRACTVLYCHLWPVWLYHIFAYYLINGTIFGEKLLNMKRVFWFSLQILSETFSFWEEYRDILSYTYIDLHVKYPLFLSDFNESWIFFTFSKNTKISNLMKIRPVGAELFHAEGQTDGRTDRRTDRRTGRQTYRRTDGRTDRHGEANSRYAVLRTRLTVTTDPTFPHCGQFNIHSGDKG